jgi:hypothetical protein
VTTAPRTRPVSAAKPAQVTRRRGEVCGALQKPDAPGIGVGKWTLRWMGDCWSVGKWKGDGDQRRWREASWHARLEYGLGKLLRRNVEGDASDVEELLERVDRAYCGIVRELQKVR